MSDQEYRQQVKRLAAVFDAVPTSKAKADEFVRSLSSIPVDHLAIVVDRMIDTRTSGFMPTPGEVKEQYIELVAGPPMPDEKLQWCLDESKRLRAEQEAAYYSRDVLTRGALEFRIVPPDQFPDEVTRETVRLIGWRDLIEMDEGKRKGLWAVRYAEARAAVVKRMQAGEMRLSLPQPENVRPIKAGVA